MADMTNLPDHFRIVGLPVEYRFKAEDRAFSHGSVSVGDNKAEARKVELEGYIDETSEENFWGTFHSLMAQFRGLEGCRLYLDAARYLRVAALYKADHEFYSGFPFRKARLKITLYCADPVIHAASQSVHTEAISASPAMFPVTNGGGIEVFPVITITANGDCTNLTLENLTDGGRKFQYQDPNMVSGAVLTIDGEAGTVYRGNSNVLNFYNGAFLRLMAGSNSLKYTGGNCTIGLTWRNGWL
jgi:hypothetical protein